MSEERFLVIGMAGGELLSEAPLGQSLLHPHHESVEISHAGARRNSVTRPMLDCPLRLAGAQAVRARP